MSDAISIDQKTLQKILTRLDALTREVKAIKTRLQDKEPLYGSDEWWEWSDKRAVEDINAGRTTTVRNKKELREFFDSLK